MRFIKNGPGILLCLAIAIPAWVLGKAFPVIGSPVFGILLGMFIGMFLKTMRFECGIKYTSKKLLQYSIILLGFEMNLFNVLEVGVQSLFIILFTLAASFVTAYIIGKALGLEANTTVLISVGTSICGGSAIAATAPVIKANDKDVAQAISTIFLFNIIAVFIFPALGHILGMTDIGFGMWAGTAINDTSSVVAAGAAWSNAAGNNTALAFATIVKLTRTLMIIPITFTLAIYTMKHSKGSDTGETFEFRKVFPWFILGFIAVTVINTILIIPVAVSHSLVTLGKFVIVMAMIAIGLKTNIKSLIKSGVKPIFLGLSCWLSVASVSLLVQKLLGLF